MTTLKDLIRDYTKEVLESPEASNNEDIDEMIEQKLDELIEKIKGRLIE